MWYAIARQTSGYPTDLVEVEITGIPEALKNLTEAGAVDPMVKINVHLSESGFVSVQDAVVQVMTDKPAPYPCRVACGLFDVLAESRTRQGGGRHSDRGRQMLTLNARVRTALGGSHKHAYMR